MPPEHKDAQEPIALAANEPIYFSGCFFGSIPFGSHPRVVLLSDHVRGVFVTAVAIGMLLLKLPTLTKVLDLIRQAGQQTGSEVALRLLELQVVEADEGDCKPLVNRFKALQTEIGQA